MSKIETTKFDAADYLGSAEAIAAYLKGWVEDGTPEELRNALATVARSHGICSAPERAERASRLRRGWLDGMPAEGGGPA